MVTQRKAGSELEALAAAADGAPGGTVPPGDAGAAPPDVEPGPDANIVAIGFALTAFRTVATMALKVDSLMRTLDDDAIEKCAMVLAPVATKYGIDLSGKAWSLEIAAAMTAGPILWRAYSELDFELKARRAKPVEPEGGGGTFREHPTAVPRPSDPPTYEKT